MLKVGDKINVEGIKELEGVTLKVKLVSAKLKGYIVVYKGVNYTVPFENAELKK